MVTFIVVLLLFAVTIAFAVFLIVKKGKVLKSWFFAFGGVVLAGIISIVVAVPVTNDKVNAEIRRGAYVSKESDEFINMYHNGFNSLSQEDLKSYNNIYGAEISRFNNWLDKQKVLIDSGIYWDLNKTKRHMIKGYTHIPYVIYKEGEYKLIME